MTKKEAKKMNKDIETLRSSMAVMNAKGDGERGRTNTVSCCPAAEGSPCAETGLGASREGGR
jgi:hypothetical protein